MYRAAVKPTSRANRLYRRERKRLGLCPNCNADAEPGKSKCRKHLDEAHENIKRHLQRKFERGECRKCKNPRLPELTVCAEHRVAKKHRRERLDEIRAIFRERF